LFENKEAHNFMGVPMCPKAGQQQINASLENLFAQLKDIGIEE